MSERIEMMMKLGLKMIELKFTNYEVGQVMNTLNMIYATEVLSKIKIKKED